MVKGQGFLLNVCVECDIGSCVGGSPVESCPSPLGNCPNMHICQHVLTQWANTCMS